MKLAIWGLLFATSVLANETGVPAPVPEQAPASRHFLESEKYSFQVRNASVRAVAEMIAERAGLSLSMASSLSGRVSFSLRNQTLLEALDLLSSRGGVEYEVVGNTLQVRGTATRNPAAAGAAGRDPLADARPSSGQSTLRSIPLQFATASAVVTQAKPLLSDADQLIADDATNALLFQGGGETYGKLIDFLATVDRLPPQILIDAQVVETSRSFLESIGVSYGATNDPGLTSDVKMNGLAALPGPTVPNLALRYNIMTIGDKTLDVKIAAAESSGDAKVVSRPKVVTLNNTAARVNSGVSFFVKTLTPLTTASSGSSSTSSTSSTSPTTSVTGGIQRLQSGLQLDVTPTIMGKDLVRLKIQIDNSQPDESTSVDGIPGIISNAATTSVIVANSRTAVIAGLIKNSKSHSENAVPFLSKIPVIGALFTNFSDAERNNELVIFITPHLVSPENDLRAAQAPPLNP